MSRIYVTAAELDSLDGIRHGFFTRHGGTSAGLYESNNCGLGTADSRECIEKNRTQNASRLALNALVTAYQQHTPDVIVVEGPWGQDNAPKGDALVTKSKGIALGILTADCAPVLLADRDAQVIGAAHAGWKGALSGVLANTVSAMESLGAQRSNIVAAIGPCIAQTSYEVGPEFMNRFVSDDKKSEKYFTPPKSNGHVHFDLTGFVKDRLLEIEVGTIAALNEDTCAQSDMYFSYRRSVLNKESDYGRQLSAIGMPNVDSDPTRGGN